MMDYVMRILAMIGVSMIAFYFIDMSQNYEEPELFDSLLCSVHTPPTAILVTHELIKCTDGRIYRRVDT